MDRESLLGYARKAAEYAYAPYSHFRVGAAVVVTTGTGERVVTAANVENASLGLTLCAERAALAAVMAQADAPSMQDSSKLEMPAITQVAVACIDAPEQADVATRMPCGACRQWLAELAPAAEYYVDGVEGTLSLNDLLPNAFRLASVPASGSDYEMSRS